MFASGVQMGYDAGFQQGFRAGLEAADTHAEALWRQNGQTLEALPRLPVRDREQDRAARDRVMLAEGARMERERQAFALYQRAHRGVAA